MTLTSPKRMVIFSLIVPFASTVFSSHTALAEPQNMTELINVLQGTYSSENVDSCTDAIAKEEINSFTHIGHNGIFSEVVAGPDHVCHDYNACNFEGQYRQGEYTYVSPTEFRTSYVNGSCIIDTKYALSVGGDLKNESNTTDQCDEPVKRAAGKDTLYRCEGPILRDRPTADEVRYMPSCFAIASKSYLSKGKRETSEEHHRAIYTEMIDVYPHMNFPEWSAGYKAGVAKMRLFRASEVRQAFIRMQCNRELEKMEDHIQSLKD